MGKEAFILALRAPRLHSVLEVILETEGEKVPEQLCLLGTKAWKGSQNPVTILSWLPSSLMGRWS